MLSYTKKAIKFTEEILNDCIRNIKKFRTEKEVYLFLVREARKRKLRLAFKPLVVTSPNGFEIHHKPTNKNLKKGFLIIDYGLKYKGYCSDITRTIYLGKPSEEDIYQRRKSGVPIIHCCDSDISLARNCANSV